MIPRIYFASLMTFFTIRKNKLPDHKCSQQLAEDFSLFFMCKIQKITDSFPVIPLQKRIKLLLQQPVIGMHYFTLATENDISQIISKTPSPTCLLDSMPTSVIKQLLGSHNTETTFLLKVHNDIMWTMEKKGITIH